MEESAAAGWCVGGCDLGCPATNVQLLSSMWLLCRYRNYIHHIQHSTYNTYITYITYIIYITYNITYNTSRSGRTRPPQDSPIARV